MCATLIRNRLLKPQLIANIKKVHWASITSTIPIQPYTRLHHNRRQTLAAVNHLTTAHKQLGLYPRKKLQIMREIVLMKKKAKAKLVANG